MNLSDFDLLNSLNNGNVVLGRKRDNNKLYVLKTVLLTGSGAPESPRSEEVCMKIVNRLKSPFISGMHWSFEDRNHLYIVMVSFEPHMTNLDSPRV